jgi:thiol-disulfide isomerase/thioredoxin
MNRAARCALAVCLGAGLLCAVPVRGQLPDLVRIPLSRIDRHVQGIGAGLVFDAARVAKETATTPVTLPDPLPPGGVVGFNPADKVFVLLDRVGPASVGLTVDANGNRDLRDDARVEVAKRTKSGDGVIIPIRRTYPGTPPRDVWLLYRFEYNPDINARGEVEPGFFVSPAYRMEGTFRVGGREYVLQLFDFNMLGLFDRSNLSRGTVLYVRATDDPPENAATLWGHELIPLGDEFYEVRDGALDGSSLEIARNTLVQAAIGRVVPDFRLTDTAGQAFELRDYRGRYLLLDFWPSWCVPCIQEFATIKKTVERYASQPLSVVGINLDSVDRGSGIAWVDGDGPGPGPTSPWESTLGVQRLRPMRPSVP